MFGQRECQLAQALVGHRGDREHRPAALLQLGRDDLGEFGGVGHVDLVEDDDARPVREIAEARCRRTAPAGTRPARPRGRRCRRSGRDRARGWRSPPRAPAPRSARCAAGTPGRARGPRWHRGSDPGTSATVKVCRPLLTTPRFGTQRGERVVGDLRLGRRQHRHQRRLAGRREPDQTDVGDGLELQDEFAASPGSPSRAKPGALRALEASEALPSPPRPPCGSDERGAVADQVGEDVAVGVEHHGAVRHRQHQVVRRWRRRGCRPAPCLPLPALACGWKWKSSSVCTLRVDHEDDVAAVAAVAAVGAAEGLELLAMDRGAAVAAVAGLACSTTRSTNVTSFSTLRASIHVEISTTAGGPGSSDPGPPLSGAVALWSWLRRIRPARLPERC